MATDARVTQLPVEVLYITDPAGRVTQLPVEVLYPSAPSTAPINVTQTVLESAQQYSAVPVRASGTALESVYQYSALPIRTTALGLEISQQYAAAPVRVTQLALEILRSEGCFTPSDESPEGIPLPGCPPSNLAPRPVSPLHGCAPTLGVE